MSQVSFRMDERLKADGERLFKSMGMNMSNAPAHQHASPKHRAQRHRLHRRPRALLRVITLHRPCHVTASAAITA